MKNHILPKLGDKLKREVGPSDISGVLADVAASITAQKSRLNIYTQLKTIFAVAEDYDLIERSPVRRKVHRPKYDAVEKPAWSAAQVRCILEHIPECWFAFFCCLALTTVRIGELLALSWKDIDWDNRRIRITKAMDRGIVLPRTKNREKQVRHIPDVLFAVLKQHQTTSLFKEPDDLVFCKHDGSASDADEIRDTVLYPSVDHAGIERLPRASGFHAFRHAGSTIISELTGDLKLCQLQLGHKRMTTTGNIYTHRTMAQVQRAGNVLAEAVFGHQLDTKTLVSRHQGEEASDEPSQVQ